MMFRISPSTSHPSTYRSITPPTSIVAATLSKSKLRTASWGISSDRIYTTQNASQLDGCWHFQNCSIQNRYCETQRSHKPSFERQAVPSGATELTWCWTRQASNGKRWHQERLNLHDAERVSAWWLLTFPELLITKPILRNPTLPQTKLRTASGDIRSDWTYMMLNASQLGGSWNFQNCSLQNRHCETQRSNQPWRHILSPYTQYYLSYCGAIFAEFSTEPFKCYE